MRGTHPISLASGVLPEFGAPEVARAATAAGFDAVGLWVDPKTWTADATRQTRARLADAGLPVLDVEVVWIQPGADDPDHLRLVDIGAELGAANVLAVSSDPHPASTADKLGRLVDHAAARGLRVSLEFGVFTEVKTLADALKVVELCGRPEAGVLVDPIHLDRSGGRPEQLAAIDPARLAYAQFCDAPAERPDVGDRAAVIEDAVDLRMMPGEGALPLAAVLAALPPGLPLSMELRSKALRDAYPDPVERAKALARATRGYLNRVA